MRRAMTFFSLLVPTGLLAPAASPAAPELPVAALLAAIAEVESANRPGAIGPRGERGLYQFRCDTWKQHTALPFTWAHNPAHARYVAEIHLRWLQRELRPWLGVEPDAARLADAWHRGLTAAKRDHPPTAAAKDYVERVVNLYHAINRQSAIGPRQSP